MVRGTIVLLIHFYTFVCMIEVRSSEDYLHTSVILEKITEYDIFRHYCHNFKNIGDKFCSELRKDKSPTCSIIYWNKKLLYKDFGTGESHDCFSYIQAKYNLTFVEALRVVDVDFCLNLSSKDPYKKSVATTYGFDSQAFKEKQTTIIKKKARKWTVEDQNYWNSFGIRIETLTKFAVEPISHFWINDARFTCDTITYAYNLNGKYKLYSPLKKENKWISNTDSKCIQGIQGLQGVKEEQLLILTKSLKDVMCLYELGYYAIALQSEMIMPSPELIKKLRLMFYNVVILYDNDYESETNPGQTMANKICEVYGLQNIIIPSHYEAKDISDLIKSKGKETALRVLKLQLPYGE